MVHRLQDMRDKVLGLCHVGKNRVSGGRRHRGVGGGQVKVGGMLGGTRDHQV